MGAQVGGCPDVREVRLSWEVMFDLGVACVPVAARGKNPTKAEWQKSRPVPWDDASEKDRPRTGMNVGAVCGEASGGLFVLDFDTEEHGGADGLDTLRRWESEHGELPETVCSVTGSGGLHLWYRSPGPVVTNDTNPEAGVDVRGEGGFVVIPPSVHPNGTAYEWEASGNPEDVGIAVADDNVMAFLESVKRAPKRRETQDGPFVLPDHIPEGMRNSTLFKYASKLRGGGFSSKDIMRMLEMANKELCDNPLGRDELERICNSACKYKRGRDGQGAAERLPREPPGDDACDGAPAEAGCGGRPDFSSNATLHRDIARHLIGVRHCKFIGGVPAIWEADHYETGWTAIDRAAISCRDDIKKSALAEVRERIATTAPRVPPADDKLIAFSNGVLDVSTLMFEPNTPDLAITNIIPHGWEPGAQCDAVDEFLSSVSGNDPTTVEQLCEVVGMCMMRSAKFEQCALLVGDGANGKSTFIRALRNVLGDENVSALDVCSLAERFQAGALMGKLANLGDDISNDFLHGNTLSVFKKVASGDWVWTDVKGMDGLQFRPICTMVISCNEFPRLKDSSYGMLRRLVAVGFTQRFDADSGNVDLDMGDRLCTEEAAKALISRGVAGLRTVIANRGMTRSEAGETMIDDIRRENNSVVQWIDDMAISATFIDGSMTSDIYRDYADWCGESGMKPYALCVFTRNVNKTLGIKTSQKRENGRVVRIFTLC